MAGLVTVATFDDRPSALIARSMLDQHGIPAFLADENFLGVSWHLTLALGGIRLTVPEQDQAAAEKLLDQRNRPPEEPEVAIDVCPRCEATDIFRLYSWGGFAFALALVWMYSAFVPVYVRSRRRFCRACGNRWTAEPPGLKS